MGFELPPEGQMSIDDVVQARATDAWAAAVAATWVFRPVILDHTSASAVRAGLLADIAPHQRQE